MEKHTELVVLRGYFGIRPVNGSGSRNNGLSNQDRIKMGGPHGFLAEFRQLSDEEKLELAKLAALEMGLKPNQVSFPLTE